MFRLGWAAAPSRLRRLLRPHSARPQVPAAGSPSNSLYPRELADLNGDHRADIIGFGNNGPYVALANPDGSFALPELVLPAFGAGPWVGGWSSQDVKPRELADIDGDGRLDIVGFSFDGIEIAFGFGDGSFGLPGVYLQAFGDSLQAGGWTSVDRYPRQLFDMNLDGAADIVGFGNEGLYVAFSAFGSLSPWDY